MTSPNILNKLPLKHDKTVLLEKLQIMLQHFQTYNFLQISKNNLSFDINGENLREIIRREWFLKNITLSENPAFYVRHLNSEKSFKSVFKKIRDTVCDLPFSLVEIYDKPMNGKPLNVTYNAVDLMKNQFQLHGGTILKNQTLCTPQVALEFFQKQQREHKIWWRKFAALPGRFNTTEISTNNDGKLVEIKAEFPWGSETVETIKYFPGALLYDFNSFKIKINNDKFVPHIITCETSLEVMCFTYLLDSYEILNNKTAATVLRFSRKLAPYKIAFASKINSFEDDAEHLKDLATLLAKQIRKNGISVLLLPDMCSTKLEDQICRNDAMGVPFTVILSKKTLKDGIISIHSRDTTLEEESHVSLIVSYLEKLMKSNF